MNTYEYDDHVHEDLPNLSPPYHYHSSSSDNNSSSCKSRRKIKLKVRQKNANKRQSRRICGVHVNFPDSKGPNDHMGDGSKGPNDHMGDGIEIETRLFDTCSNSNEEVMEVTSKSNKDVVPVEKEFVDEEELFNMPVLMDSMAEGLLLTPPAMRYNWDDDDTAMDLTLWRH